MVLLFEVMDKELSISMIWGVCLFFGAIGFFLARKNPLFLLFMLPLLPIVYSYSSFIISEINDPFVGPDIIREAGYSYVVQSYLSMAIAIALPILGIFIWIGRKKKSPLL